MAIKLPDPGNGIPEQKTGNDEWTNMKIVRDNFADQSNAASRLVGTANGNVMEVGAFGIGSTGLRIEGPTDTSRVEIGRDSPVFDYLGTGLTLTYTVGGVESPSFPAEVRKASNTGFSSINLFNYHDFTASYTQGRIILARGQLFTQHINRVGAENSRSATWGEVFTYYHTGNTTTDVNKNIKTSSPVLQVFKDGVKKIHEANQLPIKFTRNGVGDYTIEGTTGLRENDWQIVIPKDDHDNQLIAFTMKDDNGTIHLKTYKRTFSMEAFLFGPDLSAPVDIPDGLWVDLHFNDLPQEQLDEPVI